MNNGMTRLVAAVWVAFLVGVTAACAQTSLVALATGPDISADHMSADSNHWFRASGNVFIRYADHDLRADQVDLNTTTGEVQARGHIEMFRQDQGRWSGDKLDYNYITKEGMFGASEVRLKSFAVMADETRSTSNGMKKLIHGRLTTCAKTNAADWHYWIAASEIDFRENDRVSLYDAVPYFMGVPFFYVPYATRDLNHPFGPRLTPGYRSSWGPYLLSTYTYPLYNPPGKDELVGNVLLDYRASRGLAYGHEVDWVNEKYGDGQFGFYLTDDQDPNGRESPYATPVDASRYRLYLLHEANPTPDDQVLVRGDMLSDQRTMQDFFPELFRDQSQPDNFFDYTHRGLTYATGAGAAGPLNNTFNGVGRVPEGWLRILPQELFEDSGLYYESDNSAGYYVQQWSNDGTLTNALEPDTVRIHSRQKLTYPFHAFEVVSIVPRAAYDYTFYSNMNPAAGKTNEVRSLFELGTEASVKWFANYDEYRHVVEPYVDYAIVTAPSNVKRDENYFFDRVDGPREWSDQFGLDGNYAPRQWHGVRPGVRNAVQEQDADGNRRTVFDWDVFVAYRLGGSQGETNATSLVGWDTSYRPTKDVRLRTQGLYDPEEGGRMDQADSSLTVGEGRNWTFELGYFISDPLNPDRLNWPADPQLVGYNTMRAARLARASLTHRFNSDWSANLFTRYNLEDSGLDEVGGYLQYDLDCLAFRMTSGYLPAVTRYDGSQRQADYRVSFMVWVKALQPDNIEKLRGW
jgi:lipopolysaccharide assembly outer membrane protein LptD (OstA)